MSFSRQALLSILIGSSILYGQSATATLSGTASDSSGAYAPGVSVSAAHTATGLDTEFSGINGATQLVTPGGAVFSSYPNVAITNNLRPAGSTAALGQFFGEYNGARDPRIIQLGVKVYF